MFDKHILTIEPARNDNGYDVVMWDREGNNSVVVGHASYATAAATLASDICDVILSWLPEREGANK